MSTVPFTPFNTTNAANTFGTSWDGLIQGTAFPDPAVRFFLATGILASTETLPMWGGVGISEAVPTPQGSPPTTPSASLGGLITRATTVTATAAGGLTGFSVFEQAYAMVNSPSSPVPVANQYGQVMFYRLGSGARIAVAMAPALVDLEGNIISQQVSWDFGAQQLCPYVAAYPAVAFGTLTYNATTGNATGVTTSAHGIAVGDVFTVSGCVPTGYNGTWTALSGTTGSTIVWAIASNPGAETTLGQINAGGGALNVRILKVDAGNSMTVNQPDSNGNVTWNRSGYAAVILI